MLLCIHYKSSLGRYTFDCKIKKLSGKMERDIGSWKGLSNATTLYHSKDVLCLLSQLMSEVQYSLYSPGLVMERETGTQGIYYLQDLGVGWYPQKRPFYPQMLNVVLV